MSSPNHCKYKRIEGIENAVHNNDRFFSQRILCSLSFWSVDVDSVFKWEISRGRINFQNILFMLSYLVIIFGDMENWVVSLLQFSFFKRACCYKFEHLLPFYCYFLNRLVLLYKVLFLPNFAAITWTFDPTGNTTKFWLFTSSVCFIWVCSLDSISIGLKQKGR